ncbi:helix-turn-helix domain-containing protein [Paenibacillus sp. JX-17]|uniref:Helix-turn-helix domain-containing protein n=1 Tax=Paenibacillus lacisoli TaxID=3064525 RepID=A0ABT9CGT4_9BACL|nr:PucR family transcriptional regulator [Paenibacillus sp. JX-17]MDO7908494.1 helix-turn-helix domain-containing protein [Paenibacillus sp. JX-17]
MLSMRNIERICLQLENTMGIKVKLETVGAETYNLLFEANAEDRHSSVHGGRIYFALPLDIAEQAEASRGRVLSIAEGELTDRERGLIELLISGLEDAAAVQNTINDDEAQAVMLGEWIEEHQKEYGAKELPDQLQIKPRLCQPMLSFVLVSEGVHAPIPYDQLSRLLDSYFGGEVILVPLQASEWLILAREEMVIGSADERDRDTDAEESEHEVLTAFGLGLYELIATEWVGNFHMAAVPSVIPAADIIQLVRELRETLFLGRVFHVAEQIHFAWELRLEKLIYSIPDRQREKFLDLASTHSAFLHDSEVGVTLSTFFQMDCNVSETAKRLYVHRNTLIYRLDKIKQETGLDVRRFEDAVLVKLLMLLYKVTKTV